MPDSRVASSLLPIDRIYRPILFLYIKYIHKIAKPITQNSPTGKPLALENTLLNQVPLGKKILGMDTRIALSPLENIIVPKVAINAGSFNLATRIPLMKPNRVPIRSITGIVIHKGIPII